MNPLDQAKDALLRTTGRMLVLVAETPDDKLFWKPSPSARSIGEIVAHSAHALANITSQLQGTPFPVPTSAQANAGFLEHDAAFSDRASLLSYFEEKRDGYIECLESFGEGDLDRLATLPFGLGEIPLRFFIGAGADHTSGHVAQIEYVQTIYGDHNWHSGF